MTPSPLEIFLVCAPGLESILAQEADAAHFASVRAVPGGVAVAGGWDEVRRANIRLRGASRVLARVDQFRAVHLAQLDKRARKMDWAALLRPDVAVKVEASCKGSRIYHSGAAAERVANAISDRLGAPIREDAPIRILVRIQNNVCTISVDTSGAALHQRGFKRAVAKAPMRETLAALFLRACDHEPGEPVLDPMCGSGTFVIEAAEIAAGLQPGRSRGFAFQHLAMFDPAAPVDAASAPPGAGSGGDVMGYGSDRDPGATRMATENARRAGVGALCRFQPVGVKELQRPNGPPGLIMVNPPYGDRVGNRGALVGVHRTLGQVLRERFSGWRVGLVTSETALARATGLPFEAPGPIVDHGGIKIRLHRTAPLI